MEVAPFGGSPSPRKCPYPFPCTCLQRDGCPKIINLGSAKTDLFYERKKVLFYCLPCNLPACHHPCLPTRPACPDILQPPLQGLSLALAATFLLACPLA